MNSATTNCRSCGARIIWARTEANRRAPLDATPQKRAVLEDRGEYDVPVVRVVDTYVSHFATCPNATQHRKKPSP